MQQQDCCTHEYFLNGCHVCLSCNICPWSHLFRIIITLILMKKYSSLLFSVKSRRNYKKKRPLFLFEVKTFLPVPEGNVSLLTCIGLIWSEQFGHNDYEDLPHNSGKMLFVYTLQKNVNVHHLYGVRCCERSPSKQLPALFNIARQFIRW